MATRAARWAAQRAAGRLANRGDTHFAAEKRLYKVQLKELRQDWLRDDLLARREFYVQQREAKWKQAERSKVRALREDADGDKALEVAISDTREALSRQHAKYREASRRAAERLAEERQKKDTMFRRKWLQDLLQGYDVEGNSPVIAFSPQRKRAWLTPENFDSRLHMLLMRSESPIDKWNKIARKLESDEQKAFSAERTGQLQSPPSAPAPDRSTSEAIPDAASTGVAKAKGLISRVPGGGSEASPVEAASDVSSAEDKAILEGVKSALKDLGIKQSDQK